MSKRKVPHPYSRAGEGARSLHGVRDDDPSCSNLYWLIVVTDSRHYLNTTNPPLGTVMFTALPLRDSTVARTGGCARSAGYTRVSLSAALCRDESIVTQAERSLSGSVLIAHSSSSSTKM